MVPILAGGATFCGGCTKHFRALTKLLGVAQVSMTFLHRPLPDVVFGLEADVESSLGTRLFNCVWA